MLMLGDYRHPLNEVHLAIELVGAILALCLPSSACKLAGLFPVALF